jgi:hypothetical protein
MQNIGLKKKKKAASLKLQAPSLTRRILSDKVKTMKEINYKNKKLKLPYDLKDGETSTEMVTRQNPFSGQSIELPEFAAVVYDKCVQLNHKAEEIDRDTKQKPGFSDNQDDWQLVRNGLDWFRRYFAKEYMVLLD